MIPVILASGNAVRHCNSVYDAARLLKVPYSKVYAAMNYGRTVRGWRVHKDEEKIKKMQRAGSFTNRDMPRVNPIFLRKPYSSTSIWERMNERH